MPRLVGKVAKMVILADLPLILHSLRLLVLKAGVLAAVAKPRKLLK